MKVYFHEDQLKSDTVPQLAISPKKQQKKERSKGLVISPLVSVLAMVAIGIGAFAIERSPNPKEDPALGYTPTTVNEDAPAKKLAIGSSAGPGQADVIQPMNNIPALPQPEAYNDPYLTSVKETTQPAIAETVVPEPISVESKIEIPAPQVSAKVVPDKVKVNTPLPPSIIAKVEEKTNSTLPEPIIQGNKMERARILFGQQKYFEACALSRLEMNNGNKAQRHEAVIITAQCYLQLGYKPTAQHLLEFVISEGGPGKKDAKRILAESQK